MDNQETKLNIESKIIMINEFRQHLFRALDIKTLISKDLIIGSSLLQKDVDDDEGLRLLKRAYKNESPLLDIITKGLEKSNTFLSESMIWIKSVSSNDELLSEIDKIKSVLDIFNSAFDQTVKRFKKENDFLSDTNVKSFEEFMISWSDEIQSLKSLILSVDSSSLDDYFKRINVNNRLAMRSGFGSNNFYEITKDWSISFKDDSQFSLYFSYCSLLGSISLMILTFHELERSIDKVNAQTLKDLNIDV
jgi:hypothetical protein